LVELVILLCMFAQVVCVLLFTAVKSLLDKLIVVIIVFSRMCHSEAESEFLAQDVVVDIDEICILVFDRYDWENVDNPFLQTFDVVYLFELKFTSLSCFSTNDHLVERAFHRIVVREVKVDPILCDDDHKKDDAEQEVEQHRPHLSTFKDLSIDQ
jgi:hypothetical protein